jgi:chemotaxis protein MotB
MHPMNKLFLLTLFAASLFLVTSSCVTKKKYLIAENGRLAVIEERNGLKDQLDNCLGELDDCQEKNHLQAGRLNVLMKDTVELGRKLRNYLTMLDSEKSEQEKLNDLLKEKMSALSDREKTIEELQGVIDEQNRIVHSLLASVKDALLGFGSDELSITEKNGKVYVAMSDKLLFESGSATVDKRGKEALAKLAEVLNKQRDIDVYIEGHTDSKPIKTVQFKDNWDLSVIRATSVVRILTKDYDVNELQIQPTGRGEYMPVANNETADGRSKNRRTEIIMAPKLDKLYELLK